MPRSVALALALLTLALAPAAAHSAIYTQYACQLPDGSPAVADAFDGYVTGASAITGDGCLRGKPLFATIPGTSYSRTEAELRYFAPSDTTIFGVRVLRDTANIGLPGNAAYALKGTTDRCVPAEGCPNGIAGGIYSWTGATTYLNFAVYCPDSGCTAPGPTPTINIHSVEIDLNDAAVPRIVTPPTTGLFDTARALHGTEAVVYAATDAGGGVASASVVVDGAEVDRRVPNTNNGGCKTPYTWRTPCALRVDAAYDVDTTKLSDGPHTVALQVRDATEVNQATYGPVAITVDNRPPASGGGSGASGGDGPGTGADGGSSGADPLSGLMELSALTAPNGTGASAKARLTGAHGTRTIRYGSGTVVRGRLEDEHGAAIGQARLDILARVLMTGAKRTTIGHVTTSASGAFSYRVPAGASRDVTVAYRARSGDAGYATTRLVTVQVQAGVRLSRSRRTLRNGRMLTLTAQVLGGHVRKRAATISFQVKVGSRWRTFGVASIDAHGRASIRHRFRYTTTATGYDFRAHTVRTASFPYVTGTSKVARVTVRP